MRRVLSLLAGLGLGIALSQFPEFSKQYEQRLGGAVDELRTISDNFDAAAARAGLDRNQALATFSASNSPFLASQGSDTAATLVRYDRLKAYLATLENAGFVSRLVDFAQYYDPEIGARTLSVYKPAIPVTADGFIYAGAGFVSGYAMILALLALLGRPFRRNRRA